MALNKDHAQKLEISRWDVRITTTIAVPVQQVAFLASPRGLKLAWSYTERGRTGEVLAPSQLTRLLTRPTAVTSAST